MKLKQKIVAVLTALSLMCSLPVFAANADGSITKYSTYTTKSKLCNGTITTSGNKGTQCSVCGVWSSYINWECSCGRSGGYSSWPYSCTHNNSGSTDHYISVSGYKNSEYGYFGDSSTFNVWPISVTARDGITYSLSVSGATATDAAIAGKTVYISLSGISNGTYVKITNTGTNYSRTIIYNSVPYKFTMPAKPTSITFEVTTVPPQIVHIGDLDHGPYSVSIDYNVSQKSVEFDGPSSDSVLGVTICGGVISSALTGKITMIDSYGGTTVCDPSTSDVPTIDSTLWKTSYMDLDGNSNSAILFHMNNKRNSINTITYTPSAKDIANGFKYGYRNSEGSISSFTTVTSTLPITFDCKYFAIISKNFPNEVTTIDPTSSFSSTSVAKKYGDLAFSAGFTTDSDGTLSYSSSNTSVATISSSGSITITGVGSTTITASTEETSSYYADSKTMTLTISKGTISVSTKPSASSIQYGQTLASSIITGGSTKNQAGNSVAGAWSWKSPATVPNAGTTSFMVIFTPSDKTNYNY